MAEPAFDTIRPGMTSERAVTAKKFGDRLRIPQTPELPRRMYRRQGIRSLSPNFVSPNFSAEGRRLEFAVCVEGGGKLIGEGSHRRTVIPVRS